MTIAQLDSLFPYLCLAYGVLMTIALNLTPIIRLADERLPVHLNTQWKAHRGLALVCLVIGGAWVLQNLWLT